MPRPARRRWRGRGTLAVALLTMLASGAMVWHASEAAFKATTGSPTSNLTTGTVAMTDNDAADTLKLFDLTNVKPGDTATSCITVTYTGSLGAAVSLYGTTTGTGLASYVTLTVTRGTTVTGFGDCGGFTADPVNYSGLGNGVVYTGALSAFPSTFGTGVADPRSTTAAETWTTGEAHAYKIQVVVQDTNSAQGKTLTSAFTWQAAHLSTYADAVTADSPVAYWQLDETSGTAAKDAVGGNPGTYAGAPMLNQSTPVFGSGGAVTFTGGQYVNVPDTAALNPASAISIEAWVKINTMPLTGVYDFFLYKNSTDYGVRVDNASGTPRLVFLLYGPTRQLNGVAGLSTGQWYHFVATYNGTTMKTYINGVADGSQAATGAIADTANALTIMTSFRATQAMTVDDVAVYNTALSLAQVQAHYAAGIR